MCDSTVSKNRSRAAASELPADGSDIDAAIEPLLLEAVAALDGAAPLLAGMARFHLGYARRDLRPLDRRRGPRQADAARRRAPGRAGRSGDPPPAAPVGAAVELLHNFTLIHDDVQDEARPDATGRRSGASGASARQSTPATRSSRRRICRCTDWHQTGFPPSLRFVSWKRSTA